MQHYFSNNRYQILTISQIVSFVLLTLGLLTAWNTPCIGYEPNIYASTPVIFWAGVFASYAIGILAILYSEFIDGTRKRVKYLGYLQMVLSALSVMCLHVIRGHKLLNMSGDTGTHVGNLMVTITSGAIPYTYYPGAYTEPALFELVSGLDSSTVLSILPIVSLTLFTIMICLIGRQIFPHKGEAVFTAIIALLLPSGTATILGDYNLYYVGMTIPDVALLPVFIFFIILTLKGKNVFLPLLITSVSILFYHPYVTVICFVIYAGAILFSILPLFGRTLVGNVSIKRLITSLIIMLGSFFTWYWSFFGSTIISGIKTMFEAVGMEDRGFASTASILQSAGDYGYGIETILKIAGINIFIYGMLVIAGLIFLRKYWNDERYFLLKALYVFAAVIGGMMVVAAVGDFVGGYLRFKQTIYIAALLSTGFVLYRVYLFITKKEMKITLARISAIFLILLFVCGMSVMSFHPSPNTYNSGYQTTQTIYTGAETLLPLLGDYNKELTGIHLQGLARYAASLYGITDNAIATNKWGNQIIISSNHYHSAKVDSVPYHFGYDTGIKSMNETYNQGDMIFIIEKDREFYQAYYPEIMWDRWTPLDFEQLNLDTGLRKVYYNGGLEMYLVH